MSLEAAKEIAKFSEGVVNALDAQGYPLSVRQLSLPYDGATGTMPLIVPESLGMVEGPASLLCHFHDEKMWNLRSILIKGRVVRQDGRWQFRTISFEAPSFFKMMSATRANMKAYLAKRNLPVPVVNFTGVKELWQRAAQLRDP